MFTPHSVLKDKWTSIDGYASRIFSDDFCHENHLTWKVNSVSTRLASLKFKEKINYESGVLKQSDELKYWFPVENDTKFLFIKATNDYAKLHADLGVSEINGQKFNFYGSLGGNKNGSNKTVKLGFQNISGKCNSDTRFKADESKVRDITNARSSNFKIEHTLGITSGGLDCWACSTCRASD